RLENQGDSELAQCGRPSQVVSLSVRFAECRSGPAKASATCIGGANSPSPYFWLKSFPGSGISARCLFHYPGQPGRRSIRDDRYEAAAGRRGVTLSYAAGMKLWLRPMPGWPVGRPRKVMGRAKVLPRSNWSSGRKPNTRRWLTLPQTLVLADER